MTKHLAIDLCCGSGGWSAGFIAEGYDVIGYDICAQPDYPGELRIRDVRSVSGHDFPRPTVILASPPCEEFSRHQMPWTRRRNPPEPDLSIVEACRRIAAESGAPMILENVRMAQGWLGRARAHVGPFYLWGDVPAILPDVLVHRKESLSSTQRLARARVPIGLSKYIAQVFKPEACRFCGHAPLDPGCGKYGCANCHGEGLTA